MQCAILVWRVCDVSVRYIVTHFIHTCSTVVLHFKSVEQVKKNTERGKRVINPIIKNYYGRINQQNIEDEREDDPRRDDLLSEEGQDHPAVVHQRTAAQPDTRTVCLAAARDLQHGAMEMPQEALQTHLFRRGKQLRPLLHVDAQIARDVSDETGTQHGLLSDGAGDARERRHAARHRIPPMRGGRPSGNTDIIDYQ